jgi:lysozyme
MIEQLKQDLLRDEGVVKYVYVDSLGYWSIGAGFLVDQRKGGGLRDEEIDFILDNRIRLVVEELSTRWPPFQACPEPVQRALCNAAYQLGVGGLLRFQKALAAIEAGDYEEGADEMLRSRYAVQTPARAARVSALIREG